MPQHSSESCAIPIHYLHQYQQQLPSHCSYAILGLSWLCPVQLWSPCHDSLCPNVELHCRASHLRLYTQLELRQALACCRKLSRESQGVSTDFPSFFLGGGVGVGISNHVHILHEQSLVSHSFCQSHLFQASYGNSFSWSHTPWLGYTICLQNCSVLRVDLQDHAIALLFCVPFHECKSSPDCFSSLLI